ncbi:MAG TPA: hypothetical protein VHL11_24130, partial [Phototrophicaceae bacterium]|nr:hypothetical protein [Phototrophicaceae bacterium]
MVLFWLTSWTTIAQPQSLTYGEPVAVDMDGSVPRYRYNFDGTADEEVYVSAFTIVDGLQLSVEVFGPNGTSLGEETANAIGTIVGPIKLASTGRYTIEVTQPTDNQGATGAFQIMVDHAVLTPVKPDGRYNGTLPSPGAAVFFSYTGPENELFGYAATGQNIGFFMRQPDGRVFITNSDYGSGELGNPLNVLPMSGQYIAFLQTFNDGGTDYSLRLTPVNVVKLESGDSVSGQLTRESVQVFRFTSNIDELWRVDVTGDLKYNSRMEIRSTEQLDTTLAADQTSGINGAPRIDPFISGASGDYYIILTTSDSSQSYDYTLTLTPSPAVRMDSGVSYPSLTSGETGAQIFVYFGVADEVVRVTMESSGGNPRLWMYSPTEELATFSSRSKGQTTIEVTLPQTGLYRFY